MENSGKTIARKDLIKQLLPGFIPLFIFILADELWDTKTALAISIAVGIAEFAYTYIKNKRIDGFILLDTAFLVVLGAISILLENDIFFKLKPALIEAILVILLGISAFSGKNIVLLMSGRYLKNISLNHDQEVQFTKNLKVLFFVFALHTLLIVYSAYFMSKEAWVFISGGLFYIIFGVYFFIELVRNRFKRKKILKEEWLPLVNQKGELTGKAPRSLVHANKDMMHPVVHLHVLNSKGEIFLQKRQKNKLVQPGKWDTAVGGHISINEDLESALKREAFEEIGLADFKAELVIKYKWVSEIETELVFSFITIHDKALQINTEEVEAGRFWSFDEIESKLGKNIFTPNFEYEFGLLRGALKKRNNKFIPL